MEVKLRAISCLWLACMCLSATAQSNYWQQQVDYKIDVKLNEAEKALEGFEKLEYYNNSPDTLHFIWFHIWPNAYKNDKTAFSDQLLENRNRSFYYAPDEERGYINKLNFESNGKTLETQPHPLHADIIKVLLNQPLAPGTKTTISTPFYVRLPRYFSRSGYIGKFFMATQWYPKPAVYDREGWHAMPYLDQGEFYSEFGNFEVHITVPSNYIIAASGHLQNMDELEHLKSLGHMAPASQYNHKYYKDTAIPIAKKRKMDVEVISRKPSQIFKTLTYKLNNSHDFAWFASKEFIVQHDTLQLQTKTVDVFAYYFPWMINDWSKSLSYIKAGTRFYSDQLGEYPYNVVTAVGAQGSVSAGGMEYPTITLITMDEGGSALDATITHEIGHNWFYGILATNERKHVWMDEGMNSFYEKRYMKQRYGTDAMMLKLPKFLQQKLPASIEQSALEGLIAVHKDQPIATAADSFTQENYGLIAYYKAATWMATLEKELGIAAFDNAMKQYYEQWKFKHPSPIDFKNSIEQSSGVSIDSLYQKLYQTGSLNNQHNRKKVKPTFLFNFKETDKYHYISFLPAAGYNKYDGFMAGLAVHNYQLPSSPLKFFAAPLLGTTSSKFNYFASADYTFYTTHSRRLQKVVIGANTARFSINNRPDSNGNKVFERVSRIVPSVKVYLKELPRSSRERWIDLRSFIITEQFFNYTVRQSDLTAFPEEGKPVTRYIHQLSYNVNNGRILHPYNYQFAIQQGESFYRAQFTGNYFFNYPKGGGLNVRWFAAKFGYLRNVTQAKKFQTIIYQPKLTAVRGDEDYTYSNYFIGRSEFEGFGSRQIMMRDGGLKLRTDLFQGLQGRSENWIASMNLTTTLPRKLLPIKLPIRLFFDVGTYAEAWKREAAGSRFLYVGGIQLSIFNEVLNIYAPLVYSKEFRNSFKSVPELNNFGERISFSIDINRLKPTGIVKDLIF